MPPQAHEQERNREVQRQCNESVAVWLEDYIGPAGVLGNVCQKLLLASNGSPHPMAFPITSKSLKVFSVCVFPHRN